VNEAGARLPTILLAGVVLAAGAVAGFLIPRL
jgi:hypothetical protein